MSAALVAAAITALNADPWVPPISHWEIATTDGLWGAHGEVGAANEDDAYAFLRTVAETHRVDLADDGRTVTVDFEYDEVPVRFWWLRPIARWIVPERCATCPTALGDPGVAFVRLGEGDREAPVICVPCRDAMHTRWVSTTCPADGERADHHWWFSLPDNGWKCTTCSTVRTDVNDPATTTRQARVEAGGAL